MEDNKNVNETATENGTLKTNNSDTILNFVIK